MRERLRGDSSSLDDRLFDSNIGRRGRRFALTQVTDARG